MEQHFSFLFKKSGLFLFIHCYTQSLDILVSIKKYLFHVIHLSCTDALCLGLSLAND